MSQGAKPLLRLDPRTGLLLLVVANLIAFSTQNTMVGHVLVGSLLVMMLLCSCYKLTGIYFIWYALILTLQYIILPILPAGIGSMFAIIALYSQKTFPCLIVGTVVIKRATLRRVVLAMRKLHLPQRLIIPLSVTMRYFPSLKEEVRHIGDAMKLRSIPAAQRLECFVVPLMMSATGTAEELSAAAVTRGIENPAKKTSVIELRMGAADYVIIAVALLFAALALGPFGFAEAGL